MTGDQEKLLAIFEVRMHDLLSLCEEQKTKIKELTHRLTREEEHVRQAKQEIQVLEAKYANLLTAHVVSVEEGDMKNARMRLLKLVREVNKCITLLNGSL
jgi:septal ring factor EnvC (AmiA/AmiB activator)